MEMLKKGLLELINKEPTRALFFYPELFICFCFLAPLSVEPSHSIAVQFFIACGVIFLITSTKWFNHLGEGYRYLEYGLTFLTPVIIANLYLKLHNTSAQYYLVFLVLFCGLTFSWLAQKYLKRRSTVDDANLKDFLKMADISSGDRVFPICMRLGADLVAETDCSSFWWQPGGITDEKLYQKFIHEYPYLTLDWRKIAKEYRVNKIIIDKSALRDFEDSYNFEGLKKLAENSHFCLLAVDQTTD